MIGIEMQTIHAVSAQPESELVKLILVIDNRPREFVVARHVVAAIIARLAEALAKG